MSNIYEKTMYNSRKEYMASYYQEHKADLSRKAHERYEAKKKQVMKQRKMEHEGIKSQICDNYCKYVDDANLGYMSRTTLKEICERCPMSEL